MRLRDMHILSSECLIMLTEQAIIILVKLTCTIIGHIRNVHLITHYFGLFHTSCESPYTYNAYHGDEPVSISFSFHISSIVMIHSIALQSYC